MTARLEAARAAVFTAAEMYAPVHQAFSEEGKRRLTLALGEHEAAVIEANKPAMPQPPTLVPGAVPPPVAFREPPTAASVAEPTAPAPANVASPKDEIADSLPPPDIDTGEGSQAPKGKRKK